MERGEMLAKLKKKLPDKRYEHSIGVAYTAATMAFMYGIDYEKAYLAGLLHDIGMIGVAEDILNKTQKLSDEEFEKIKMHVHYSVKILEDIKEI